MSDARVTGLRVAKVLAWATHLVVAVAIAVLVLAFVLQLFNASTAADFTQWVYRAAERVMQPFRGIFPTVSLGDRGSVLDLAMLFAIIAYGLLAQAVDALVSWLDRVALEQRAALRRHQDEELRAAQEQRDADARARAARPVGGRTPGPAATPLP